MRCVTLVREYELFETGKTAHAAHYCCVICIREFELNDPAPTEAGVFTPRSRRAHRPRPWLVEAFRVGGKEALLNMIKDPDHRRLVWEAAFLKT